MTKCMNVTTGNLRYVRYVLYGRVRGTPYVSTYVRGAVSSPLEISNDAILGEMVNNDENDPSNDGRFRPKISQVWPRTVPPHKCPFRAV